MRVLRTDRRMLCREMIYMTYAPRPQREPGPSPEPITEVGALGGTRTPTMLLTATSRQRVYQFRHERLGDRRLAPGRINGADVTNQDWGDKGREACDSTEIWAGSRLQGMIRKMPAPHLMRGGYRFSEKIMQTSGCPAGAAASV